MEAGSWLLVSNGHGEDHVAALIASELRVHAPDLALQALPLVGLGDAYAAAGVPLLDPRAALPSAGLTMHHPRLLWADLRAGLIGLTLRQVARLRGVRVEHVVVVGDVYAQALSALVPAPRSVVQTLVSVRMHSGARSRFGPRRYMEGFHWPELPLMRARGRRGVRAVYLRDEASAAHLRRRGVAAATCLGNVMMDGAVGGKALASHDARPCVALLPGSRRHASDSARLMLAALARSGPVLALVAWTPSELPARPPDWHELETRVEGCLAAWRHGDSEVWWLRERFRDVLASADAVLGTSGTAQEQAAGLGLPVVSFPQPPLISAAFLANQQRLLGPALTVSAAEPGAIAASLSAALSDERRREAARVGPERMGPPGAAARIACDLLERSGRPIAQRPATARSWSC